MPDRESTYSEHDLHCKALRKLAEGADRCSTEIPRLQQFLVELQDLTARLHDRATQAAKSLETGLVDRVQLLQNSGRVAAEALLALLERLHMLDADALRPTVSALTKATVAMESTLPQSN